MGRDLLGRQRHLACGKGVEEGDCPGVLRLAARIDGAEEEVQLVSRRGFVLLRPVACNLLECGAAQVRHSERRMEQEPVLRRVRQANAGEQAGGKVKLERFAAALPRKFTHALRSLLELRGIAYTQRLVLALRPLPQGDVRIEPIENGLSAFAASQLLYQIDAGLLGP